LVDEAADKTLRGIRVPPGGGDDDVEKEEEDDPFKDVPGPIANALKGLTQVVQRMDSRMDDISAELSDLDGGASRKRKRGDSALGDINEEEDEDRRVPMRGAYGKCEPITVRFAYLDARVRDAAIAGTLALESLPLLIPPTADIFRSATEDLTFGFVLSPGSRTLRAAIPTRSVGVRYRPQVYDGPPCPLCLLVRMGHPRRAHGAWFGIT